MSNEASLWDSLQSYLSEKKLELGASEVHGTLVGAVNQHLLSKQAPDLLRLFGLTEHVADTALLDAFSQMYRHNGELLLARGVDFVLVLPEDGASLAQRTENLAQWCQGYLLGLLHNTTLAQLPENSAEIAKDILQIAEADAGHDEQDIEDKALFELEEYVKVAVLLIFENIYQSSEQADDFLK